MLELMKMPMRIKTWLQPCPSSHGSLSVPSVDFVVGSIAAFFWSTGLNLSYELFERRDRVLIAARQRGRHVTGTVNQRRSEQNLGADCSDAVHED